MHKMNLLRIALISLAVLCASAASAQTYTDLVGTGFSSWPSTSWVPIPSLDEGRDKVPQVTGLAGDKNAVPPYGERGPAPWTDFVGNSLSDSDDFHAAYYQFDTQYLYFRMRVDAQLPMSQITDGTFGDQFYIYIDYELRGSVPGCPDYAISWDVQNNLQLSTVTPPTTGGNENKWLWNEYGTPSPVSGYLRMVTGGIDTPLADLGSLPYDPAYPQTITNYDPNGLLPGEIDNNDVIVNDAWIDWAIRWDSLGDINYGDTFSINYGSARYPLASDPENSYWDIAAGEEASANEFYNDAGSWSPGITAPEPASMALTLVAVGLAGGIARRRKARNEAGREE